jgi:hypothetical protein
MAVQAPNRIKLTINHQSTSSNSVCNELIESLLANHKSPYRKKSQSKEGIEIHFYLSTAKTFALAQVKPNNSHSTDNATTHNYYSSLVQFILYLFQVEQLQYFLHFINTNNITRLKRLVYSFNQLIAPNNDKDPSADTSTINNALYSEFQAELHKFQRDNHLISPLSNKLNIDKYFVLLVLSRIISLKALEALLIQLMQWNFPEFKQCFHWECAFLGANSYAKLLKTYLHATKQINENFAKSHQIHSQMQQLQLQQSEATQIPTTPAFNVLHANSQDNLTLPQLDSVHSGEISMEISAATQEGTDDEEEWKEQEIQDCSDSDDSAEEFIQSIRKQFREMKEQLKQPQDAKGEEVLAQEPGTPPAGEPAPIQRISTYSPPVFRLVLANIITQPQPPPLGVPKLILPPHSPPSMGSSASSLAKSTAQSPQHSFRSPAVLSSQNSMLSSARSLHSNRAAITVHSPAVANFDAALANSSAGKAGAALATVKQQSWTDFELSEAEIVASLEKMNAQLREIQIKRNIEEKRALELQQYPQQPRSKTLLNNLLGNLDKARSGAVTFHANSHSGSHDNAADSTDPSVD